jgi:hypothetical protein
MTSTVSCQTRKTCTNYLLLQQQLSETNSPTRPLLVLSSLQGAHEASQKHSSKTRRPLLSTKPLLSNPPTLINSSHNLLSPYQKISQQSLPTISQQPAALVSSQPILLYDASLLSLYCTTSSPSSQHLLSAATNKSYRTTSSTSSQQLSSAASQQIISYNKLSQQSTNLMYYPTMSNHAIDQRKGANGVPEDYCYHA